MSDSAAATSFAILQAKRRGLAEIGPDEILLGCLQTRSQFGIVDLGGWSLDLEALGIDWLEHPETRGVKVAYSERAVEIFDRASRIARTEGETVIRVEHLLAAFAQEESGLMGELKARHGITSASWRAAVARLSPRIAAAPAPRVEIAEYLTPEEAAEALGIHVQTVRSYVRSGKLPAMRLAGERAIRIRREDLSKAMERVVPESQEL